MRRAAAILAGIAVLSGCGVGAGEERGGDGVELRVTRDFGRELLSHASAPRVKEDDTVMRLLRSRNAVTTRFGGRFVQSIDGLKGRGTSGFADWFFYVNGIAADKGAAEYELSPGDVVQWDYRDWRETMDVRAIVGAFPEPFVHGVEGKRRAVRVECDDEAAEPCRRVKDRLRRAGVPATGSTLGASGSRNVIRVVVAPWARARELPSARLVEQGPRRSGVFARFRSEGRSLDLLDEKGNRARTLGSGAGLVAATEPREEELVWLVTGADDEGLARAARALDPRTLRDAFAVAVGPQGTEKLPVAAR